MHMQVHGSESIVSNHDESSATGGTEPIDSFESVIEVELNSNGLVVARRQLAVAEFDLVNLRESIEHALENEESDNIDLRMLAENAGSDKVDDIEQALAENDGTDNVAALVDLEHDIKRILAEEGGSGKVDDIEQALAQNDGTGNVADLVDLEQDFKRILAEEDGSDKVDDIEQALAEKIRTCIKQKCKDTKSRLEYVASSIDAQAEHQGVDVYGGHYQSAQQWVDAWNHHHQDDAQDDQKKTEKKAIALCEKACRGAPLTSHFDHIFSTFIQSFFYHEE